MKSRYIIFADDDADDLEMITGFFKQYNRAVHVFEFRDGREVLNFLEGFLTDLGPPIIIVLDINMPRLNGKETLESLRKHKHFQHIPVVMFTTSSNAQDEAFCRALEASWMHKPSSAEGVRQTARILADFCQQVT